MARVRLTFRQRDVTAAIKAIEAAGHTVSRIEIAQDGRIVFAIVQPGEEVPSNALDEWLKDHAHEF